jgi:hypothetical protein
VTPAPAKTGNAGLVEAGTSGALILVLAATALMLVISGRIMTWTK